MSTYLERDATSNEWLRARAAMHEQGSLLSVQEQRRQDMHRIRAQRNRRVLVRSRRSEQARDRAAYLERLEGGPVDGYPWFT